MTFFTCTAISRSMVSSPGSPSLASSCSLAASARCSGRSRNRPAVVAQQVHRHLQHIAGNLFRTLDLTGLPLGPGGHDGLVEQIGGHVRIMAATRHEQAQAYVVLFDEGGDVGLRTWGQSRVPAGTPAIRSLLMSASICRSKTRLAP